MDKNNTVLELETRIQEVTEYLQDVFDSSIKVLSIDRYGSGILGFVYLIDAEIQGKKEKLVLKFANPNGFDQDFASDRANTLIYANSVYNKLPCHVKSFDVGGMTDKGILKSLGTFQEFFLLMEYAKGQDYARDLDRIGKEGKLQELDLNRAILLSEYMAKIHRVKEDSPGLYVRRIRDLIGKGDCISGIIDSYPKDERTYNFTSDGELEEIEKKCVEWRWKIKGKTSRLCQVHGDFHPFNILWEEPMRFTTLDRSRGEWGEAADDVACLSINYIFWSLIYYNGFREPFNILFDNVVRNYLRITKDQELTKVIQPFYAFRSLVVANPLFYPNLSNENRRRIFNFMKAVLETETFEVEGVNSYLKG